MLTGARLRATLSGWAPSVRFPDATNTGATLGTLTPVGASGTGWVSTGTLLHVTGANVTLTGLTIPENVTISAANCTLSGCLITGTVALGGVAGTTISNCVIISTGSTSSGIQLQAGTTGTTISDCTISGTDSLLNRVSLAIQDSSGGDPGLVIQRCNLFWCRVAASPIMGIFRNNYCHDPGFRSGDHTDGISNLGTAGGSLLIQHNTMLMAQNQTSSLDIGSTNSTCSNITIDGNFLAGGSYGVYCGNSNGVTRIHAGCTTSSTTNPTVVLDSLAAAGDVGATVTGTGIPASSSIVSVTAGTSFTLNQAATASGTSSMTLRSSTAFRTDAGCVISGGTTLTDAALIPADAGIPVTGTGIPTGTTISGTPSGGTATLSQACTNAGSLAVTFHYTSNFKVTNNRFSQAYYPQCGLFGSHTLFDTAGAGNVWSSNVYHDTGAVILATDP